MSATIGPARVEERVAALRLLLRRIDYDEREQRVERALALLDDGEIPAEGLLVGRECDVLTGAMVAIPLAGAAALVWPPVADDPATEDALTASALAWLRRMGCKFAQALLDPSEADFAAPLRRSGFLPITTLLYLQKQLGLQEGLLEESSRLSCQAYTVCDHSLFHKVLLQSYVGALDCPELNDVRTIEEVVGGYQGIPGNNLDHWWLAWHDGRPAGVLITIALPSGTWDLSYVGLVSEARGKGLGTELTRKALREAWAAGAEQLTLTVDVRNGPALRMYARLGFEEFDRREVYLRVLTP